jgi:hypothetical protein
MFVPDGLTRPRGPSSLSPGFSTALHCLAASATFDYDVKKNQREIYTNSRLELWVFVKTPA